MAGMAQWRSTLIVVYELKDNLLGLPAIKALNLIVMVNATCISGGRDKKNVHD